MDAPETPARVGNSNQGADGPGALKGTTKITLHTRQAVRLFKGRRKGELYPNGEPKPPIPGVYGFGNLAKQLQTGSMHGDPYADWHFIRIDTEISEIETYYHELEKRLDALLGDSRGFDVSLHMSKKPCTEEVAFFSPYTFKACHIVIQADRILTKLLGANHYALIKRAETEKMQASVFARVRRLFAIPAKYRFSGTTRADFSPRINARGQRAIEMHGSVPEAILNKSVQPAYGNWRSLNGKSDVEDAETDSDTSLASRSDETTTVEKEEPLVAAAE